MHMLKEVCRNEVAKATASWISKYATYLKTIARIGSHRAAVQYLKEGQVSEQSRPSKGCPRFGVREVSFYIKRCKLSKSFSNESVLNP